MRILVGWCPDWSVVAALGEAGLPPLAPAAVLSANRVEVCNASARAEGVRRGQRRRDAQARCPELALLGANPDRDARAFEPVLATVEELRPGVAALRPGLLAVRAPGRFFGGEEHAAAILAETLVDAGVRDCRFGVADDLFTAEQAARMAPTQEARVVRAGGSAAFLRDLPLEVLTTIPDLPQASELVSLLRRLGLDTLGEFAALPLEAITQRLGRPGVEVWRRVRGEDATQSAGVSERTPPPDLVAEVAFEPPLDSVEAVCFSTRTTAERFLAELASRHLVATEVRVEAEYDGADGPGISSRTWLHPRCFSSRDLIDRVHWQLQAHTSGSGLRSRRGIDGGAVRAPIERVRFVPETVEPAHAHAQGLWGGGGDDQVERGVARVQAMVGFEAVVRPVLQGGRSPSARQAAVPWGERATTSTPREQPWPGQIPGPAPVRVFARPIPAEIHGDDGRPVAVSARGAVTGIPARLRIDTGSWQPVAAWAGPWPVDEQWWGAASSSAGPAARFQMVGVDGRAWLAVCRAGTWLIEAGYD
ncbi:DNA polymerase Y family protein [Nocardioides sp. R-C-SC26]|uniref:DNA polymerase Y family protein n=1 Tax=Nocardioides sp. R-C-SC26 TaxID=2870414 RepID=UPI001E5C4D13|nr:DNA polymerase Y family protein [Nocardioides sp. R-C-SC26]